MNPSSRFASGGNSGFQVLWGDGDPKHLEFVFEAFYSTNPGMGMGLSICRSIIAAHEGRLWAAATEPRGALFQFTLPSAKSSISGPFTTRESRKKASL